MKKRATRKTTHIDLVRPSAKLLGRIVRGLRFRPKLLAAQDKAARRAQRGRGERDALRRVVGEAILRVLPPRTLRSLFGFTGDADTDIAQMEASWLFRSSKGLVPNTRAAGLSLSLAEETCRRFAHWDGSKAAMRAFQNGDLIVVRALLFELATRHAAITASWRLPVAAVPSLWSHGAEGQRRFLRGLLDEAKKGSSAAKRQGGRKKKGAPAAWLAGRSRLSAKSLESFAAFLSGDDGDEVRERFRARLIAFFALKEVDGFLRTALGAKHATSLWQAYDAQFFSARRVFDLPDVRSEVGNELFRAGFLGLSAAHPPGAAVMHAWRSRLGERGRIDLFFATDSFRFAERFSELPAVRNASSTMLCATAPPTFDGAQPLGIAGLFPDIVVQLTDTTVDASLTDATSSTQVT